MYTRLIHTVTPKLIVAFIVIALGLVVSPKAVFGWPAPLVKGDCSSWEVTEVAPDRDWQNTAYWTIDGVDGQHPRGASVNVPDRSMKTQRTFVVRWYSESGKLLDKRPGTGSRDLSGCYPPVTEPPTTEPPVTEPPSTEPPVPETTVPEVSTTDPPVPTTVIKPSASFNGARDCLGFVSGTLTIARNGLQGDFALSVNGGLMILIKGDSWTIAGVAGPTLQLWDPSGTAVAVNPVSISEATNCPTEVPGTTVPTTPTLPATGAPPVKVLAPLVTGIVVLIAGLILICISRRRPASL